MEEVEQDPMKHLNEYMDKFSCRMKLPQTTYESACFYLKEYVLTLGRTQKQEWKDVKMANEDLGYYSNNAAYDFPEEFKAAVEYAEKMRENDKIIEEEQKVKEDQHSCESNENDDSHANLMNDHMQMIISDKENEGGESDEEEKLVEEPERTNLNKQLVQTLEKLSKGSILENSSKKLETLDDLIDKKSVSSHDGTKSKDKISEDNKEDKNVGEEDIGKLNDIAKRERSNNDLLNMPNESKTTGNNKTDKEEEKKEIRSQGENDEDHEEAVTQTPKVGSEERKEDAPQNIFENNFTPLKTVSDRFNELDQKYKQIAANYCYDLIAEKQQPKNLYQGFDKEFLPEGYQLPENEKQNQQEAMFMNTNSNSAYFNCGINDIYAQPPMLREMYQISLWKVDDFGIVRVKDRYFTPKSHRAHSQSFSGFTMSIFEDKIALLENSDDVSSLVVILDPYSLKIVSETEVLIQDQNKCFEGDDINGFLDYSHCSYPTFSRCPKYFVWNKGKYLMSAISPLNESRVVYYNIYDTSSNKIVSKIEREGELKTSMCFSINCDVTNPDYLYFSLFSQYKICIGKI